MRKDMIMQALFMRRQARDLSYTGIRQLIMSDPETFNCLAIMYDMLRKGYLG